MYKMEDKAKTLRFIIKQIYVMKFIHYPLNFYKVHIYLLSNIENITNVPKS
jgi:hypothetical protein